MKTLLVLAEHPELAEAVRAGINPDQYRVLHRASADDAEPLLVHGVADGCIVDVELVNVQAIWLVDKVRRHAPKVPVIVYSGSPQREWEEEAYLRGVAHVLAKPVRPRLLAALLERLWPAGPPVPSATPSSPPSPTVVPATESVSLTVPPPARTLGILRDFSKILTHSLNAEGMIKQFLLQLREILGFNRAAVFLRQPLVAFGGTSAAEGRRLRAACSFGLSPGLLQHFELSFDSGIGGHVFRSGRILRQSGEEIRNDIESQKEFELLGAQVAVPLLDRETVLGVAVLDGRITGEPLANAELELIFHLLEQLGLAVRNIWLYDQLAANHEMLAEILRELGSACVVVSRDLTVLHANRTARKYFMRSERRGSDFEFTDLPQVLGTKVYQVLKTGAAVVNFRYEPEEAPGTVYNVCAVPFQRPQAGLPGSALLMVEDLTQSEQLRRLEVEAGNLRLVRTMADRLTHEIGNAMVPLSTHQQLLADKWRDAEFRGSLDTAMAEGVKRVTRLVNQMRFLAREPLLSSDAFPLAALLEEAYQEACKYQPAKASQLRYDSPGKPIVLRGDRAGIKHALAEVMLNALQANPAEPKIEIRLSVQSGGNGAPAIQIELQDSGSGFTPEAAEKAFEPFCTNRTVGLGLGLTVSRKIIENHRGRIEIMPPKSGQGGIVRITLPIEAA